MENHNSSGFWGDLGWYSRVENNGWRPLAVRFASEGLVDKAWNGKTQGTGMENTGHSSYLFWLLRRWRSSPLVVHKTFIIPSCDDDRHWNSCGGLDLQWPDEMVRYESSQPWVGYPLPLILMILPHHVNPGSAYFFLASRKLKSSAVGERSNGSKSSMASTNPWILRCWVFWELDTERIAAIK